MTVESGRGNPAAHTATATLRNPPFRTRFNKLILLDLHTDQEFSADLTVKGVNNSLHADHTPGWKIITINDPALSLKMKSLMPRNNLPL